MARPLYVLAFEQFKQKFDGDQLKGLVAFGLFIDAEYKWAGSQPAWPSDGKCKQYHEIQLPHHMAVYDEHADKALLEFADGIVEAHRESVLEAALAAYRTEAAKSHHRWWHGVLEAAGGALLWSIILVAGAYFAGRLGIDVLGAFESAAVQHSTAPAPAPTPAPAKGP